MTDWSRHYASRAGRMQSTEVRDLLRLLERPGIISFAGGIPDPALFPKQEIAAAFAEVLNDPQMAGVALQYTVSEGYRPLREWIATHMGQLGLRCTAENVLVVNGSQQALDLTAKLFVSPGDTILVSRPTFLGALQAFNAYEPHYATLPDLSDNGPASSGQEGRGAKFGYVMPEFENPTGRTLTLRQRQRLLDFARDADLPLLEDTAYQTLRYDGEAPPPLIALAAERDGGIDRCSVLYCGTFSKSVAPGLRIGWMVGPQEVISRLALVKQGSDIQASTLNQIVLHRLAPTLIEAHARRIRPVYRARRDAMLAALDRFMPKGVRWTRPDGGMFIWVTLPPEIDGAVLLARAIEEEGVAFVPGVAFFADRSGGNHIRLSFATSDEAMIEAGISRLGRCLAGAMSGTAGQA